MGLQHERNRIRSVQHIDAIRAMAQEGQVGAVIWYRGLTAGEMYEFQMAARKANISIKVVRNRLAHRGLEETVFACLQPALKGPVLLAFSQQGPGVLARLLRDFAKNHQNLVTKYLAFDGELLPASDLDNMANLPTKEEAIVHLLAALQSPVQQLLRVLMEPSSRFVRTMIAAKKGE